MKAKIEKPKSQSRIARLRTENTALRQKVALGSRQTVEVERKSIIKDRERIRALAVAAAITRQAKYDTDEIRHRLKNTISVVQAIANATFLDDVPVQVSRAAFNDRLSALSSAHDILIEGGWESASVAAVVRGILMPYRSDRFRTRGPEVALSPKPALAFALALNELASNASKYGALSNGSGCVDIVWTAKAAPKGRELQLRWRESGGPEVTPPTRVGFGSRLIRRNLAAEFSGKVTLEYPPGGVVCTLIAPLL